MTNVWEIVKALELGLVHAAKTDAPATNFRTQIKKTYPHVFAEVSQSGAIDVRKPDGRMFSIRIKSLTEFRTSENHYRDGVGIADFAEGLFGHLGKLRWN